MLLTYIEYGMCCTTYTQALQMWVFLLLYISLQWMMKFHLKIITLFLLLGAAYQQVHRDIFRILLHFPYCTISLKNGTLVHLKQQLFLLSFTFSHLHIYITCLNDLSGCLLSASYPTIKIMSAMSNTLARSLNTSSFFLDNVTCWCLSKWWSCKPVTDQLTFKSG